MVRWFTGTRRSRRCPRNSPTGPFEYKGVVIDNPKQNLGNNNHASIIEYKGHWYIAYHDRKLAIASNLQNKTNSRSVNLDELFYNDDGTIKKVVETEHGPKHFPDRVVVPNEYEAYYSVIEESKMDLNAVLLVLQYCKDAGKTSTPYVLAVVANMANDGYRTVKQVSERINELESNSEDVRQIFSALGVKRPADLDDRQLYLTWTKKQGYRLDAVLTAARSLKKRGGMDRLRDLMEELFRAGARTAEEVNSYLVSRDALKDLAINVTKSLGAFYGSTEPLIENYLQPWLNMGFDAEGILSLAKFCFLRNVKSFDGLNVYVEACYKNGVISANGIKAFIERETALDEAIKKIFAETDRMDIVTETHRKAYRAWTEWGYGYDAIAEVARSCADTAFPFRSMNRLLADLRRENVFDVEGVKKYLAGNKPAGGKKKEDDYLKHEYTKEQLDSVVKKLEDLDDDWGD